MTMDSTRSAVFPAPAATVREAIPAAAERERWYEVVPTSDGAELRRTHRQMILRVESVDVSHTRVVAEYHVERGYYTGLWDVFDFYGREVDKLLHDLWDVVREKLQHPHAAPSEIAPPAFAVGARVVALASDGQPYRGAVVQAAEGRCQIAFDGGATEWVAAHFVHADA